MTTFINDHDGKACASCGDTMTSTHSNFVPMWSDHHNDVVCASCCYEANSKDEKQYLVWKSETDYRIYVGWLPEGEQLTTQGDGTVGFVVDVSHWDSADLYEFEQAEDGDKVAQLEGLVEHQTSLADLHYDGWLRLSPKAETTPTKCEHPIDTWEHHFDATTTLGDYYTCGVCGELTQVG